MKINDLIAWHRHKAESAEATRRNAARQARDGRSTAAVTKRAAGAAPSKNNPFRRHRIAVALSDIRHHIVKSVFRKRDWYSKNPAS